MYYAQFRHESSLLKKQDDEGNMCEVSGPDGSFGCTRPAGHEGVHQAGIDDVTVVAEWVDGDGYEEFDEPGVPMCETQATRESECGEKYSNWVCTREKGHRGMCMAGLLDGSMIAQWYSPRRTEPDLVEEDPDLDAMLVKFDEAVESRMMKEPELPERVVMEALYLEELLNPNPNEDIIFKVI